MEASVKSTSNRLWQFPLAAKAALRRSTKFHTVYLSRQKAAWGIKMKKENMTIKEMWHYIIFQTKGYWTIKVALILGAIMTASVPCHRRLEVLFTLASISFYLVKYFYNYLM